MTDLGAAELFRYTYEGGAVVTAISGAVPDGYKDKVLEGYVLPKKVGATAHPIVLRSTKDRDKKDAQDTLVVRQPGGAGPKDKSMGYVVPVEDIAMEVSRHIRARHK